MKGYDNKFIDELKAKNDIVDVANKYIRLEQRGNDFWGRCPFHHEKTASFVVHGVEQFYYCFGCHKSGNVITLVMELESLDFNDAVKFLAERAKMPLPDVKIDDDKIKEQKLHKERVLALLKDTAFFYVNNLRKDGSEKHIEYILKRKIPSSTVTKFGMGASLDYDSLPNYLIKKGYTEKEMLDSGAISKSKPTNGKEGKLFDALAGRLIIPTLDQFGNVIAFCGRIIDNRKDVGKYVNTRETLLFSKGKTFFNINNLKKLKNETGLDSIIIVEGQMDVISLVSAGVRNVVASMGTAFTKDQARMIKRYAEKIYICYDGDGAGQKATLRGLEILSEEGLDVKVVSLPDGMDPDEVVKKLGVEEYKKLLLEAKPLIDFKISVLKKTNDLTTTYGKRKFASEAIKVVRESPSATEQEDLLKQIKIATGFSFDSLRRELYSEETAKKPELIINSDSIEEDGDKVISASRFVLVEFLFNKPYVEEIDLTQIDFKLAIHNQIKDFILSKKKDGQPLRFNELYEQAFDESKEELNRLAELITDDSNKFNRKAYFDDCIKTIALDALDVKIEMLKKLFAEEMDGKKRLEYTVELSEAVKQKNKIIKQK